MEAGRFAAILHSLFGSMPRRRAIPLLAGSALGRLLTLKVLPANAKNKKKGGKCKKDKKKVSVCHSGQTLRVRTSALVAHLEHGDTFGACPAPPSSFCVGKNECVSSPARCEASGPECFCWVAVGNEQPFCGQEADIRDDCSLCEGDEVCVDASGPGCGAVSACSVPCPNPQ